MKVFLLFFLVIPFNQCYSQINVAKEDIYHLSVFDIGDPLLKFENSIACADKDSIDFVYYKNSKCKSYRYLPAQKDSLKIGNVSFGTIFLFSGDGNFVKSITYYKNYLNVDSTVLRGRLDKDFGNLKSFLEKHYSSNSKKKNYPNDAYYLVQGITWKLKDRLITLERFDGKISRYKKQFVSTIQIMVE